MEHSVVWMLFHKQKQWTLDPPAAVDNWCCPTTLHTTSALWPASVDNTHHIHFSYTIVSCYTVFIFHSLKLIMTLLYLIHAVKCISPLRLLTEANKQLVMVNYSYPAIEGTTAVFSCSRSRYEIIGPRSATCTGNGEWVPDPRQVQCQGILNYYDVRLYYLNILFL